MNENTRNIGIVGLLGIVAVISFVDSHSIEDATQRWIPAGQEDVAIYQKVENGEVTTVGFTSKNPEHENKKTRAFYNEIKEENLKYEQAEKVKQEVLQEEALILEENICLDC